MASHFALFGRYEEKSHLQSNFWDNADAYFKQTRPSDRPKVFAPGLLTDGGMFVMGRVAFSPDGKEFYYSQSDSWQNGEHISMKMVRYANHQWGKPIVLNQHFLSPTFSLDGTTLFMRRTDPGSSMKNVWQSSRKGNSWSVPQAFLEKAYGIYDYMPTASGNAYVGSDPSPEDTRNGITYSYSVLVTSNGSVTVKSLGLPLNEPGFNGDLYVAPDESYMIVSAKETKTFDSELYISFRKPNSTWTVPVSLGPKLMTALRIALDSMLRQTVSTSSMRMERVRKTALSTGFVLTRSWKPSSLAIYELMHSLTANGDHFSIMRSASMRVSTIFHRIGKNIG